MLRGKGLLCRIATAACVSVGLFIGAGSAVVAADDASLCGETAGILREVSAIRGLSVIRDVPCTVQDKAQVQGFLEETIRRDLAPEKMQMEELVYRTLGIIPDDYDYGTSVVQFLVSQLGGYYDPHRKRFVMAAWLPFMTQRTVAVHELTHALQDQHYSLEVLLDPKSDNSDQNLAHAALAEGDATAVMIDDERRDRGVLPLAQDKNIETLVLQQILGMNIGSQTGSVPESLKATLIFPYSSGLRFVHAILRKGGYGALHAVYKNPPSSSREILHPDEYLAGTFKRNIPSNDEVLSLNGITSVEYSDILGEFVISSIFANEPARRSQGVEAARGWMGDRVVVGPHVNGYRTIVWLTRWEDEKDAREFREAYAGYLSARYNKNVEAGRTQLSDAKAVTMRGDGADIVTIFEVRSQGSEKKLTHDVSRVIMR